MKKGLVSSFFFILVYSMNVNLNRLSQIIQQYRCTSKQRNKQIYSYLITKNFSCKEIQEKNFHLFSLEMMYRRIYKIA